MRTLVPTLVISVAIACTALVALVLLTATSQRPSASGDVLAVLALLAFGVSMGSGIRRVIRSAQPDVELGRIILLTLLVALPLYLLLEVTVI